MNVSSVTRVQWCFMVGCPWSPPMVVVRGLGPGGSVILHRFYVFVVPGPHCDLPVSGGRI